MKAKSRTEMRPDTLMSYLKTQPFRPFRMVLNSGKTYDVRHPELVKVGRDFVVVFRATAPEAQPASLSGSSWLCRLRLVNPAAGKCYSAGMALHFSRVGPALQ